MNNEQQTQQADDPSGPGWRDLGLDEPIEQGDVYTPDGYNWLESDSIGRRPIEFPNRLEYPYLRYRRRIEPQQPSDSEPETVHDLRKRLAECEVLLAEADRGGQQVNAELQQLREQVQALTAERDEHARKLEFARESGEMSRRQVADEAGKVEQLKTRLWDAVEARQKAERELKDKNDTYQLCLQNHYKAGQRSAIDKLQAWLKPVLEVVADHPDDSSILAVSVLEFLPQIASRLIEE